MVRAEIIHASIDQQIAWIDQEIDRLKRTTTKADKTKEVLAVGKALSTLSDYLLEGYENVVDVSATELYITHLDILRDELADIASTQIEAALKENFAQLPQLLIQKLAWIFETLLTPTEAPISLQYQVIDGICVLSVGNDSDKDTLFTVDTDIPSFLFFTYRINSQLKRIAFARDDEKDITREDSELMLEAFLSMISNSYNASDSALRELFDKHGFHVVNDELGSDLIFDTGGRDLNPDSFYYHRIQRLFNQTKQISPFDVDK